MTGELVSVEERGAATWLRIERPERLNALNRPTYRALREAVERVASGERRAIVLTGSGRAFCVGADLKARAEDPDAADVGRTLREWAHPLLLALRAAPQPVIAAVNGPAVGIGCSLALACDLVVAAHSASFAFPFARVGLGPDGAAPLLAAARAGTGRAAELLFLGLPVDAERAAQWGIADRLVPDGELVAEVDSLSEQIAAGSAVALTAAKRALHCGLGGAFEAELELEAATQEKLAQGEDHRQALAAFDPRLQE